MRPPPFILVRKSNAPKGPKIGALGGDLLLELNALDGQDYCVMTALDCRHPICGPTPPECPRQGHRLRPCPQTGTQGPHGRDGASLLPAHLVLEYAGCSRRKVGAGHARKCAGLPLVASQVLCLPHSAFPMVHRVSNRLNRCSTFLSVTMLVSELHLCYHSVEQRDPIFNRRRLAPWTQKKLLCAG